MSNTQTKNIAPFAAISKDFLPYEESLEVSTQRRLKRSSSKSDSTSSIFFNLNISPDSHPDEEKGRKFKPSPSEPNIAVTFEKAADSTYSTLEGEDQDEDEDGMFDEWVVDRRQAEDTEEEMDGDDDDNLASTSFEAQPEDAEEVFWSHLSGAAVLEAAEVITLNDKGLTKITSSIFDLHAIVNLECNKADTARRLLEEKSESEKNLFESSISSPLPASTTPTKSPHSIFGITSSSPLPTQPNPFSRHSSTAVLTLGDGNSTQAPLHIFLSNNLIKADSIAWTFWSLTNITALSFRGNPLGYLPEAVGKLVHLQELNLANTNIKYLPSEIFLLKKLSNILISVNPLLSPPTPTITSTAISSSESEPKKKKKKYLTLPSKVNFTFPTLVEITSRLLLRPVSSTARLVATLEIAQSPYEELPYLAPFRTSFPTSSPQSIKPSSLDQYPSGQLFDPAANICRSSSHQDLNKEFVKCAVERFEWVSESCLKNRGQWAKGDLMARSDSREDSRKVPIKHRGCRRRCLDWLDE